MDKGMSAEERAHKIAQWIRLRLHWSWKGEKLTEAVIEGFANAHLTAHRREVLQGVVILARLDGAGDELLEFADTIEKLIEEA